MASDTVSRPADILLDATSAPQIVASTDSCISPPEPVPRVTDATGIRAVMARLVLPFGPVLQFVRPLQVIAEASLDKPTANATALVAIVHTAFLHEIATRFYADVGAAS